MNRCEDQVYVEGEGWKYLCEVGSCSRRFICRLHSLVLFLRKPWYFVRCNNCDRLRWPLRIAPFNSYTHDWYCSDRCFDAYLPF